MAVHVAAPSGQGVHILIPVKVLRVRVVDPVQRLIQSAEPPLETFFPGHGVQDFALAFK